MSTIEKKYLYKVSRNGRFLGNLQNVVSNFGYQQTIRTAGSQLNIRVGITADTADQEVSELLDESGNPITTEDNQVLTTERVPDVVGDGNEDNLIRNDNEIEIVEISDYYPSGKTVFQGYIAKWKVMFGGTDDIELTCISNGQDLTQYLIEAGDTEYMTQTTQSTYSSVYTQSPGNTYYVAQTFSVAATTTVSAITVKVTTTQANTLYVYVYRLNGSSPNPSGDTLVARGHVSVSVVSGTDVKISFDEATDLATGYTYYFSIAWGSTTACKVYRSSSSAYAGGSVYTYYWYGTAYSSVTNISTSDLYFKIWEYGGNTTAAYTSQDPTYILADILSEYSARGGNIIAPPNPLDPLVSQPLHGTTLPTGYWSMAYCQTFTPTEDLTINIIQLWANVSSGSESMTIEIWDGNPDADTVTVIAGVGTYDNNSGSTLVATSESTTISNTTAKIVPFTFANDVNLTSGNEYFIRIFFDQGGIGNKLFFGAGAGDAPITSAMVGTLYNATVTINNSSDGVDADSAYPAMYFNLCYESPVPDVLSNGYLDSGVSVTYTFQQQTVLEGVGVISDFLPYTWYWYVDPADNVLYCREISSTPDHYIIKGRHINELSLEATKERITNVAYFTGGPVAGVNIFVKTQDATSLANNRVGMVKLSDNRVITNANGTLINQNYINLHSAEEYISQVVINDSTYDITLFKLGHTIKFQGFGTFMDRLTLQIVGISRDEESITLDVGVLPKRSSEKVEELDRKLALQQTLNNPSVPS